MKDTRLSDAYERLSRKAKLFNKYHRLTKLSLFLFIVLLFSGIMIASYLRVVVYRVQYLTGDRIGDLLVSAGPSFIFFLMLEVYVRKGKPYFLTHEEWLFLDVYSALTHLNHFIEDGLEIDKKKASELLNKILRKVMERWGTGSLLITKVAFGQQIRALKQNFRERLRPAIQSFDEKNLRMCEEFLRTFAYYLLKTEPTLEDLDELNNLLSNMKSVISEKTKFVDRFNDKLKEHLLLKHALVIIGCVLAGYVVFVIGIHVLLIPIEYAYTAGIALAGTLFAGYVSYLRK